MASSSAGNVCKTCGAVIVNFTGWRNVDAANCLTMQLVQDVLKAEWFESRARDKTVIQKFPSRVNNRQCRVNSCSARSQCDNACKAASVIERWKANGINEHLRHYLRWNHAALTDFLESHHKLDVQIEPASPATPIETINQDQPPCLSPRGSSDELDDCEANNSWSSVLGEEEDDGCQQVCDKLAYSVNADVGGCMESTDYCSSFEEMSDDSDSEEVLDKLRSDPTEANSFGGVEEKKTYIMKKRRATHREVFEIFKAREFVTDELMSKLLTYWRMYMPKADWKNFTTNARNLSARTVRQHFKKFRIRKVVDGLKVTDGVPYHDRAKRLEMLARYEGPAGTTIEPEKIKSYGDCVDFNLEEALLMEGPGMLEPDKHLRLLRRIHAANPDLLSPHFLKIVDPVMYHMEWLVPNKNRSKMNYFALKWHADGVQIAKNSTKANCLPISFAVDRIAPYNPETQEVDESKCLVVPARFAPVCTTTVFHGRGKCDIFQLTEHWHAEECRLHPKRQLGPGERRRLVIENRLRIGDSPIKAHFTGQ